MKLLNLDLIAFGPFTDESLKFLGGAEGLHLIYGPNEAGKSAALRALRSLFYGIPERTSDNFLHDNSKLRIGATVRHSDGSELSFVRRKGRKATLLDPAGESLDDSSLRKYLSGVAEEVFATMFGIDHEALLSGGRELLEGRGEVAHSLYAAALGTGNLREVMKELDDEASDIFKPRGSAQTINKLIAQHKGLKSTIADLSLPSSEWKKHTEELERAQQEAAAVTETLTDLRTALARLKRLREAIPIVSERNNLLRQLQEMGEVILLTPEFQTSRLDAQRVRADAIKTKAGTEGDLQRIETEIDALDVPEGVLKEKDAINALHERLGGYRKAQQDKPTLATERDVLIKQVQNTLMELSGESDLDQVAVYRLPIEKVRKIRRLGTHHDKLQGELDRSAKRKSDLDKRLAKAERDLEKSEPAPDVSELKAAVRRARRKGDPESQMAESCAKMQKTRSQAERGLKALPLWDGTLEQLEALSVPMLETIERSNELLAELEQKKDALDGRAADIDKNAEALRHRINELQAAGEVPMESQLGEARAHRDAGWQLVRRAWLKSEDVAEDASLFDADAELPDAYEHSVQSADNVSDRLRAEADRVAELQQLAVGLADCNEKRKALEADREKNNDDTARVTDDWHSLWRNIGISPLTPKEMKNWLTRHEKLVAHAVTIRDHETEAERLNAMIEAERETLDKCLEQIGEPPAAVKESLSDLLDRCDETINRIEKAARTRGKLETKIEELGHDCHDAAEEHEAA
ncbi:MAG: AAA family ATPase, partial [Planctomycetes bacterium]|nr:AAA family ATPase [Planctomycetota bacterium]